MVCYVIAVFLKKMGVKMTGFKAGNEENKSKLKALTDALWTNRSYKGKLVTGLLGATAIFMTVNALNPDHNGTSITEPDGTSMTGPDGTPSGPLANLPYNYQPGPEAVADTYLELVFDKVTAPYVAAHPDQAAAVAERRALIREAIIKYESIEINEEDIMVEQARQLEILRIDHPGQDEKWYRDMIAPSYSIEITLRAMLFNEQNPELRMTEKQAYELLVRQGDIPPGNFTQLKFDENGMVESGGNQALQDRLDSARTYSTILSWLTDTAEARDMGLRAYSIDRNEVLKQTNIRTLGSQHGALVIPGAPRPQFG